MPPRRGCCHGQGDRPCTCEMGNLYRFTEPIVLLSLARLGSAHGYQITQEAERMAVTHAGLDVAAVYRTLRRLEGNGYAQSAWDNERPGPARRDYTLTDAGREHLEEWISVLEDYMSSLGQILSQCRETVGRLDKE